jgi:tetratricopeptide (TPR) repeat protein
MLPDAHRSHGGLRVLAYDFPGAEAAGRRALELNPGDHQARHHHALILANMGRFDEALADMERALELDPFVGTVNQDAGTILYLASRYDDAILRLRYTLEIAPEVPWAHVTLVFALLLKGEHAEALAEASGEPAWGGPCSAWIWGRTGERWSYSKLPPDNSRWNFSRSFAGCDRCSSRSASCRNSTPS